MSIKKLLSSYFFALYLAIGFSGCVSELGDTDDSVGVGAGSDPEASGWSWRFGQ